MAGSGDATMWPLVVVLTIFSLFWVFTLVPFVLSLSFRPHPPRGAARPFADMRTALLSLRPRDGSWRLTPLGERALRLDWDVVDSSWYELFAKVKLSVVYAMRLYLQEPTHEVRTYESIRTASWFVGFVGWKPVLRWSWSYQGGALNVLWSGVAYGITRGFPPRIGRIYRFTLDTAEVKREIEAVANRSGWTLYPTTLPFEVSPWAVNLGGRLVPAFMSTWSRRRFWTTLQLVSWAGIIGTMLSFAPWTAHNFLALGLVVVGINAVVALVVGGWRAIDWLSSRRTARGRVKTAPK